MSFQFAYPYLLLLALLLPLLAWLKGRHGGQPAFLYSSVSLVKAISGLNRTSVGAILLRLRWLTLLLFIIGLARPQLGEGEARVKASGVDIVITLDLSGSMAAEDFMLQGNRVNRLIIAKDVIRQFVRRRSSDRIGLVAFAGRAYIASPLTLDHDFFLENLERLSIGAIEDGTAIGSGLTAGLNRVRDLKSKSKIIILMTDGQNNAGKVPPLTATEVAQTLGVKVYTIGVGTRGKAPVPTQNAFGQRIYIEQEVNIDEDLLKDIARKTGGAYYRADKTETFRQIYNQIDELEKTEIEIKKHLQYRELYPWVVLPGLVLLLLEIVLANSVWRKLP